MDLVARLGAAIKEGLGSGLNAGLNAGLNEGTRGNEIGGILLGRGAAGYARTVVIEDFELLPSEHLRGASYTLSLKDRRVLGSRLAHLNPKHVVGFFRSHTRPGMYLDQDDFTVFSHYFPEASQVFLLVRPSTEGPAMGGFFFWEDGDVNRRSPYRQFPFDCGRLAAGGFPIADEPPAPPPSARRLPVPMPNAPLPAPQRAPRSAPQLPWMVVPVIAGLFLLAALFASRNEKVKPDAVPAKNVPPVEAVEPLLPQPEPQVAVNTPATAPAAPPLETVPVAPAAVTPKVKPTRKTVEPVAEPAPVKAVHAPVRTVEAPPVLAAREEKPAAALAAVLSPHVNTAPPPVAEVTYEQPHAGVFRRAFHKIKAENFDPPTPVRKVAPQGTAGAGDVDVKVFIDEEGNVTHTQVLTKGTDLATASADAARQWRFTPARKHDKPVASEMVLHFRF